MPLVERADARRDEHTDRCPFDRETALLAARGAESKKAEDAVAGEVRGLAEDDVENVELMRVEKTAEERRQQIAAVVRREEIVRRGEDDGGPGEDRKPIANHFRSQAAAGRSQVSE